MMRWITWIAFAGMIVVMIAISDKARGTEYEFILVREHHLTLKLKGGDHLIACFSKTRVPDHFEDCTIVKIDNFLACTIIPRRRVFDCVRKDL